MQGLGRGRYKRQTTRINHGSFFALQNAFGIQRSTVNSRRYNDSVQEEYAFAGSIGAFFHQSQEANSRERPSEKVSTEEQAEKQRMETRERMHTAPGQQRGARSTAACLE